jgi:hypothetical protein
VYGYADPITEGARSAAAIWPFSRLRVAKPGKRTKLLPRALSAEGVSLTGAKNANRFHCCFGPKQRHFCQELMD